MLELNQISILYNLNFEIEQKYIYGHGNKMCMFYPMTQPNNEYQYF